MSRTSMQLNLKHVGRSGTKFVNVKFVANGDVHDNRTGEDQSSFKTRFSLSRYYQILTRLRGYRFARHRS